MAEIIDVDMPAPAPPPQKKRSHDVIDLLEDDDVVVIAPPKKPRPEVVDVLDVGRHADVQPRVGCGDAAVVSQYDREPCHHHNVVARP